MERDCMLTHGATTILRERMMTVSDAYRAFVCATCGMLSLGNQTKRMFYCRCCRKAGMVVAI
jgi:DNA-directed RNA polymerase II subunit RPB2